ncbi:ERCC4 domain-containing protein [Pseudomonas sp. NCHU5208]|uniref:ERCC4 domain-containing protein n=1 Tax=unclassified Pseudomonas TaxID=196821 RepID=UPI003F9D5239
MIKIYVDAREASSRVTEVLKESASIELANLEVGDYVLSHDTVVLRRTANEFVEGVLQERLFNQASKARLQFGRVVILVVDGDIYSTSQAVMPEMLDSAMSRLTVLLGCSVFHTRSPHRTAALIFRMAKHAQEGKPAESTFRRGKVDSGLGHALYALEGFSAVSPSTSRKLLQHFRSVHAVVNAEPDQLQEVHGIGPSKAERLYQSLRWELPTGVTANDGVSLFAEPPSVESR